MALKDENSPDTNAWQALMLRGTAFLATVTVDDAPRLWASVVGGVPEREQRQPKQGLVEQMGAVDGLSLTLSVKAPRVDLQLRPDSSTPPTDEHWLGAPFSSALQTLLSLAENWLAMDLKIDRLAFGADIIQPTPGLVEAQSRLSEYLSHVQIDSVHSTDFFYQINRPRDSRVVSGLSVNRLSKWSVAQRFIGTIELNSMASLQAQSGGSVRHDHAARLELDINTNPAFGKTLPETNLNALFVELADLGKEISTDGDLP